MTIVIPVWALWLLIGLIAVRVVQDWRHIGRLSRELRQPSMRNGTNPLPQASKPAAPPNPPRIEPVNPLQSAGGYQPRVGHGRRAVQPPPRRP